MSSGDKPLPMDEAIAHYAGRLSDKQKIATLREALHEMVEVYWGVNDAKNGDGGYPPSCIQKGRKALRDTEDK